MVNFACCIITRHSRLLSVLLHIYFSLDFLQGLELNKDIEIFNQRFFSPHPSDRAHKELVVLGAFNLTAHIRFQAFAIQKSFFTCISCNI